ncbi:MAG: PQQ-dependent dehydrogenase, methanol/ethanol family [Proteobacteria bacterium]|nr:PQQ-dependent dehydrogenase, methanol/ethanol family [Pseudomonadota bacterium]
MVTQHAPTVSTKRNQPFSALSGICTLLCLVAVATHASAATRLIDDADIANQANTADWLAYGRTHNEQRFSPLKDINQGNIGQLAVSWFLDLPNDVGLVSTPLVADGILYFTGTMNIIRAVDARSGKLLWEYDPQVARAVAGHKKAGWVHSRGISLYGDKLFAATWDGRLFALGLKTGKLVWSTRTYDMSEALYITGAPKAFKGKVLIGNGGTESGPSRGYVSAYDADTGKLAWRFHIVPGNPADGFESAAMEMAAKTWTGKWWEHGGGGNAWHGFTFDDELNAVYIGTGNGSPWNRKIRSPDGGDNLFLCAVVALDPDTGEYKWHYQTTPGETWDYNSNMDIVLADLKIDGKVVKALMHAPKNGFFYVIDRRTGKLISAEPFADVNWATHVDLATGRPVERAGARYEDGEENIFPSPFGAHSWHAMSYNPQTGLVYLPTLHTSADFVDKSVDPDWKAVAFVGGTAVDWSQGKDPRTYPGSLQAWDPVNQKQIWSIPQQHSWASGTLTTASNLVFQGQADGWLIAYDATNGKEVWKFDTGLGISAPPITYKLDGKQMISVLVGYGGGMASRITPGAEDLGWAYGVHKRRLVTFALDGEINKLEQPPAQFAEPILEAGFDVDPVLAAQGEVIYGEQACSACHGLGVIAGGMAPDLRASAMPLSEMERFFVNIVRDGERVGRGMPGYPEITNHQIEALRHYIRQAAHASPEGSN